MIGRLGKSKRILHYFNMRRATRLLKPIGVVVVSIFFWIWTGAKWLLDTIGRTTVYDDTKSALTLMEKGLNWLFSTPWEVPAVLALAVTVILILFFWPRGPAEHSQSPANDAVEPRYASPFAGKTQSPPEMIPRRFIELIDRDEREIAQKIRLHPIPKPVRVRRNLDAPDPYLDIDVHLWNNSVFELTFESVRGRFSYKNHPLQSEVETTSTDVALTRYQSAVIKLRQYVTPQVANQLRNWDECEFTTGNIYFTFKYSNRHDEEKTVDFQLKGRCHLVSIQ